MARLPRLSLPGVMHYVLQHGHNNGAIVRDVRDVEQLLQTLREAALSHGVVLHAYAVAAADLRLLATPDNAGGISRMMQALGRRHAALFNRRHARTGALWDGRFRSALIESGAPGLVALRQIDGHWLPAGDDSGAAASVGPEPLARSSAAHRTGGKRDVALVDPPEYWQLGNTPFERESRYRELLGEPLDVAAEAALLQAVRGAWAFGSAAFLQGLAVATSRPTAPRSRGRPRRAT